MLIDMEHKKREKDFSRRKREKRNRVRMLKEILYFVQTRGFLAQESHSFLFVMT